MVDRYSRQRLILGNAGQTKLSKASIAIVGLGALGSVAAELLARAGIGSITLIDRDIIELSNLQRQSLYTEADQEEAKARVLATRLKEINSDIEINFHISDLNHKNIELLANKDLVLDCCDNLYTRFLINEFCHKNHVPWIYSAAVKDYGALMLITPDSPCFACVFDDCKNLDTCEVSGVLAANTHIIASMQANLALGFLAEESETQAGQLINFDLSDMSIDKFQVQTRQDCKCCQADYQYLSGAKENKYLSYHCSNLYQFFVDDLDLNELRSKISKTTKLKGDEEHLFFDNMSVFASGKVLVRATSEERAKSSLSKVLGL